MRIAYALYWYAFREDGVTKKIEAQVGAWRAAGHDVRVFCLSPPPLAGVDETPALAAELFVFSSTRDRLTGAGRRWVEALRDWDPDVLYVRHDAMPPGLTRVLRTTRSVVEANAVRPEAPLREVVPHLYHRAVGRRFLRAAGGLVYVSRTLRRRHSEASPATPWVVIANGADPERFPPLPAPANERPQLAFLGTPQQPWQGVDKVLDLARLHPEFDVHLVGPERDALGPDAPANASAHGFLPAADYRAILARADVAVGTLALHRKGGGDASPLKVREYLLHGIPTIIGYEDTDFPDGAPWYLLRIPDVERNVHESKERIAEFVHAVRGRRAPREDAVARLGSQGKESRRLEFMERVLAG